MGWRRYQAMVKSQSGPAAGAATTSEESTPKLSVVIKGDVDGSVEVIFLFSLRLPWTRESRQFSPFLHNITLHFRTHLLCTF